MTKVSRKSISLYYLEYQNTLSVYKYKALMKNLINPLVTHRVFEYPQTVAEREKEQSGTVHRLHRLKEREP